MAKKSKKSGVINKSAFFHRQLVPKGAPQTIIPVVTGAHADDFQKTLDEITHTQNPRVTMYTTPDGKHPLSDKDGVCGVTKSGSKLIYSPSKHLKIETDEENKETVNLYLLVREQDYTKKQNGDVFAELEKNALDPEKRIAVTVSPKTKSEQIPRSLAKKEKSVVGESAKQIVFDYFKKLGVSIPAASIEKENWNLCHLLSYAIAMNGINEDGEVFNTQIPENIFSASRTLNENMMCIENVLLQMIKENNVHEIKCIALHSEFKDSHILAKMTLSVTIITHDHHKMTFDYPFDISDDRKLSREASTAYYALIDALIKKPNLPQYIAPKKLSF